MSHRKASFSLMRVHTSGAKGRKSLEDQWRDAKQSKHRGRGWGRGEGWLVVFQDLDPRNGDLQNKACGKGKLSQFLREQIGQNRWDGQGVSVHVPRSGFSRPATGPIWQLVGRTDALRGSVNISGARWSWEEHGGTPRNFDHNRLTKSEERWLQQMLGVFSSWSNLVCRGWFKGKPRETRPFAGFPPLRSSW